MPPLCVQMTKSGRTATALQIGSADWSRCSGDPRHGGGGMSPCVRLPLHLVHHRREGALQFRRCKLARCRRIEGAPLNRTDEVLDVATYIGDVQVLMLKRC